jgi:hypothetical protein
MEEGNRQQVERAGGLQARCWVEQSDTELLRHCSVDLYKASGPGGQKRNKTSSAVRLRHNPTGLIVVGTESRSQHENKARALRRLRHALALNQRNDIDAESSFPDFYKDALERDATLRVNPKHPDYCRIMQYVLDILYVCQASVSDAARKLRLTTGQLIRFLKNDPKLWEQANRMRVHFGQQPLK